MPCLPSRTLGKARGGRGGEKGALLPGEGPSKQPPLFFSLAYIYATVWRFDGLASPGNRSLSRCIAPLHDATRAQSSAPEREGAVDHHLARHGVATQHGMNRLECGTAARHGRWSSQSWFFVLFSFSSPIQTRPQERRAGKRGEATSLPLSWNMYAVPVGERAGHDRDIHGGEANGGCGRPRFV